MTMTRAEFTTAADKENRNFKLKQGAGLAAWFGRGEQFVTRAGEDGEARVFGVGGIGGRALAEEELRAFCGLDGAGVEAACAKAEVLLTVRAWE
jgi:hypothetical protein